MNCQEFWNRLPNPPGTLPDPASEHREHLAQCAACAAHFARQAELAQGLRRLAQNSSGIQASPPVEARLLRAFRGQNIDPVRERFRWPVPLAWAATVLLAAGIFLGAGRQPVPQRPASVVQVAAFDWAATAFPEQSAEADGFIPLPSSQSAGGNGEINMVHLEVPRSAMLAVGIPVSPDRATEPVQADLLIGSDGLARAVRFLN